MTIEKQIESALALVPVDSQDPLVCTLRNQLIECAVEFERVKTERDGALHSSENWELLHAKRHEEADQLADYLTEAQNNLTFTQQLLDSCKREREETIAMFGGNMSKLASEKPLLNFCRGIKDVLEYLKPRADEADRLRADNARLQRELEGMRVIARGLSDYPENALSKLGGDANATGICSGSTTAPPTSNPEVGATPETDRQIKYNGVMPLNHFANTDFARTLELQRDAALARVKELETYNKAADIANRHLLSDRDELRAKAAADAAEIAELKRINNKQYTEEGWRQANELRAELSLANERVEAKQAAYTQCAEQLEDAEADAAKMRRYIEARGHGQFCKFGRGTRDTCSCGYFDTLATDTGNSYAARLAAAEADKARLDAIESNCWDIRCIDVPTGGGDADVMWIVIEHYMAKPHQREVGIGGKTPREALTEAQKPQHP